MVTNKKIILIFFTFLLVFMFGATFATVNAAPNDKPADTTKPTGNPNATLEQQSSKAEDKIKNYKCDQSNPDSCIKDNPIVSMLGMLINIVAGIIGVGAVLMIIWGGIQYTTARDSPQAVAAAKQKIINVVIGLAAFIFLYAFLQWLIPGGVFSK